LPNTNNPEDLKRLLIFACYIELQNVLTRKSYDPTTNPRLIAGLAAKNITPEAAITQYSISAVSFDARVQNAYSRGRISILLDSVFSTMVVFDKDGEDQDPWEFLFIPALSWFIYSLRDYWERSNRIPSDPGEEVSLFSYDLLEQQIGWVSSRYADYDLQAAVDDLDDALPYVNNFIWDWPEFTIHGVARPTTSPGALFFTAG
jgi:hypothetical protein